LHFCCFSRLKKVNFKRILMKKTPSLLLMLTILICSCAKKQALFSDSELQISHTTVCGWCAPGDSLTLGEENTVYCYYPSSCDTKGPVKAQKTSNAEWDELVSLLDMGKFNNIDLNICNVCVDGCDARVTIRQGKISHSISYSNINNEEVAPIRPFLEKLIAIQERYAAAYTKK